MEVIEERSSFLSNYEVLSLLKEEKQKLDAEKSSKGKYSNYRQFILTEQVNLTQMFINSILINIY
jgi:hypothetical protein